MRIRTAAMILGLTGLVAVPARGAPGDLDPSFGGGGRASAGSGTGYAVAVQPDGRIVLAGCTTFICENGQGGRFKVVRFRTDGTLDPNFGTAGIVTTAVGDVSEAHAVTTQTDGKIVVAGCTGCTWGGPSHGVVVRYRPDGSLDASFGSDGIVVLSDILVDTLPLLFYRADIVFGVAVQPDGKIVIGGMGGQGFLVARLNSDGSPDRSFGPPGPFGLPSRVLSPGVVGTSFRGGIGMALALQPDGNILIAGTTRSPGGYAEPGVIRYLPDGSLDQSFGSGGAATIGFRSTYRAVQGMAVQADGKIVVAGQTEGDTDGDFGIGRLTADGRPDSAFGIEGVVAIDFGGSFDLAEGIVVQPNGRLVVVGRTGYPDVRVALARSASDGTPDLTFGIGGKVVSVPGRVHDLALQSDGQIVASGDFGPVPFEYGALRFVSA